MKIATRTIGMNTVWATLSWMLIALQPLMNKLRGKNRILSVVMGFIKHSKADVNIRLSLLGWTQATLP